MSIKPKSIHNQRGNCWLRARFCRRCGTDNLCDVCHRHSLPRGECDECPRCLPCDQRVKP